MNSILTVLRAFNAIGLLGLTYHFYKVITHTDRNCKCHCHAIKMLTEVQTADTADTVDTVDDGDIIDDVDENVHKIILLEGQLKNLIKKISDLSNINSNLLEQISILEKYQVD